MATSQAVAEIICRHQIERLGYLPCEKLKWLFARLEKKLPVWHLIWESTGVALAFGYAMGKGRAALLMQSTSLGNLVTELLTLMTLFGMNRDGGPAPLCRSPRSGHGSRHPQE